MSTPYPHSVADLALAPLLIEIGRNLKWLRDTDDLMLGKRLTDYVGQ